LEYHIAHVGQKLNACKTVKLNFMVKPLETLKCTEYNTVKSETELNSMRTKSKGILLW